MDDEQLSLRKMAFDGIGYDDDWLVIWRGMIVGRILKQSGVPMGKPDWWWGINFGTRPQLPNQRGVGLHLADCKRQFHDAWMALRARLTDDDIERERRHQDGLESRSQ